MSERTCTAPDCTNEWLAKGLCAKHYRRMQMTGRLDLAPRPSLEQRFWAKVEQDPESECWLWTGSRDGNGYGKFNPGKNRPECAHRVSYELMVGPIPEGLHLDHLCRVRRCVNPYHLDPVTPMENYQRGLEYHSHRPCCPADAALRRELMAEIWRLRALLKRGGALMDNNVTDVPDPGDVVAASRRYVVVGEDGPEAVIPLEHRGGL